MSPSIPAPSLPDLENAGFRLALYPFNTIAAITDAVTKTWTGLRDTGRLAQSSEMLATMRASVQDLIGMKTYWDIEKRVASSGQRDDKATS